MQYRDIAAMVFVIHNRMQRKPELHDAMNDLAREGAKFYPASVLARAIKDLTTDVDVEVWRAKLCARNGTVSRLLSVPEMMGEVPMTEGRNIATVDSQYVIDAMGYLVTRGDSHYRILVKRYQDIICAILNSK